MGKSHTDHQHMTLDHLPNDHLKLIGRYIPAKALMTLRSASPLMQQKVESCLIDNSFDFQWPNFLRLQTGHNYALMLSTLKHLDLSRLSPSELQNFPFTHFTQLASVKLPRFGTDDDLIARLPHTITHLDLSGCVYLRNPSFQHLINLAHLDISFCKHLHNLDIRYATQLTTLKAVGTHNISLSNLPPHLVSLDMGYSKHIDDVNVSHLQELRELRVNNTPLTEQELLAFPPRLTHINIRNCLNLQARHHSLVAAISMMIGLLLISGVLIHAMITARPRNPGQNTIDAVAASLEETGIPRELLLRGMSLFSPPAYRNHTIVNFLATRQQEYGLTIVADDNLSQAVARAYQALEEQALPAHDAEARRWRTHAIQSKASSSSLQR